MNHYYDQERRKLLLLSLIFYSSNIINIFLTIKYFQAGEKVYFIVFWSLFALDKLVSLYLVIQQRYSNGFFFWFMDVLQLGFIYIFTIPYIPFGYFGVITTKLFARVLPLIISEAILFFGIGIIKFENVDDYVIILTYVNFIVFLILAIILLTLFEEIHISNSKKNIAKIMSTYLILCSLFGLKDSFDINIGYYALLIIVLSSIFSIIAFPKMLRNTTSITYVFFCGLYQMPIGNFNQLLIIQRNIVFIFYYLNLYTRFALLIVFGYKTLYFNQNDYKLSEIIEILNYCLSILFGLIQIIQTFRDFVEQLVHTKIVNIETKQDFQKFIKRFSKKNIKKILLCLNSSFMNEKKQYDQLEQHILQQNCTGQYCELNFLLVEKISNLQSQKIQVDYNDLPLFCYNHMREVMSEIKFLPEKLVLQLKLEIVKKKIFSYKILNDIFFSRYSLGYLCNNDDFLIKRIYSQYLPYWQTHQYLDLVQITLQITLFKSKIAPFMLISPSQILYDMYDF